MCKYGSVLARNTVNANEPWNVINEAPANELANCRNNREELAPTFNQVDKAGLPILRKAYNKPGSAVDEAYKPGGFQNDDEGLEHLFKMYEELTNGVKN